MELKVDGKRVRSTTGGRPLDPNRPLLVFLHGSGNNRTVWALQTRYFASHGWSVLAVDLPGHGGSEGPLLSSVEDIAAWTAELVPAAGWERAALVGHSLGSAVALYCAAAHAAAVSHLVLVATAAAMPVNPDLLSAAKDDPPRAREMVTQWSLSPRSLLGGHRTPGLWLHGGVARVLASEPPEALYVDLAASAAYTGALDAAAVVRCPTLLILGEEDRMLRPATAAPLADAIAGSVTVVVPEAGHQVHIERPDAVIDAMAAFLGGG